MARIGVLEFPIPSAKRCYKLGQSPEDLGVVLVATGGLSHQVHGERCGFNNTDWDLEFLDLIEKDPVRLTEMTHAEDSAYLAHIHHQLAGIERLTGTYPFTLARSVKAYRLNKFLHRLVEPGWRARFRANQEALFEEAGLTIEERELVRRLDWRGMFHYGVSFFMLEKLGAAVGVSNLHIYAAMRGQTLDEFRRTRNAPGALYSVAGTDAAQPPHTWDKSA